MAQGFLSLALRNDQFPEHYPKGCYIPTQSFYLWASLEALSLGEQPSWSHSQLLFGLNKAIDLTFWHSQLFWKNVLTGGDENDTATKHQ